MKSVSKLKTICVVMMALGATAANGQTPRYVDDDNACPGTETLADPYCAIQAGIDAAINGDEVLIAEGTYSEAINFNGKAIVVRSSAGAGVTTIDGTGLNNSVVKCVSGEGADTALEGFTITAATGSTCQSTSTTCGGGWTISEAARR